MGCRFWVKLQHVFCCVADCFCSKGRQMQRSGIGDGTVAAVGARSQTDDRGTAPLSLAKRLHGLRVFFLFFSLLS